jgi:hypothetical protein
VQLVLAPCLVGHFHPVQIGVHRLVGRREEGYAVAA